MIKKILYLLFLFICNLPVHAQIKNNTYKKVLESNKIIGIKSQTPLFLMEGDHIEMQFILENKSGKENTGQVSFELWDANRKTPVDGWFQNIFPSQYFTIGQGKSFPVRFPIQVPFSFNQPLLWKITASSGGSKVTMEAVIPVLNNRPLVTEKLPLIIKNDTLQQIDFKNLLVNESESLTSIELSTEYAANPLFYAFQSLPLLMNYSDACVTETFNRFFGYYLALYAIKKYPIVYSDFAQKTSIYFKKDMLLKQADLLLTKLLNYQLKDGSFCWIKGGIPDKLMTAYIHSGINKLKSLGALPKEISEKIDPALFKTESYITNISIREGIDTLMLHKQKTGWRNNIETAEACYTLILQGQDSILLKPQITIQLGNQTEPKPVIYNLSNSSYAHFKIDGKDIIPELGKMSLQVKGTEKKWNNTQLISFGALYWQYFEQINKIDTIASAIQISKQLFKEIKTGNQTKRVLIKEGEELKKGDKIIAVLQLKTKEDQEYLILKDQFSSSFLRNRAINLKSDIQPINIKKTTTDKGNQYYIRQLKAGTMVLEESYLINHSGQFHTGMTSIENSQVPGNIIYVNGIKFSVVD